MFSEGNTPQLDIMLVISRCQTEGKKHTEHIIYLLLGCRLLLGWFVWVFGRQFDTEKAESAFWCKNRLVHVQMHCGSRWISKSMRLHIIPFHPLLNVKSRLHHFRPMNSEWMNGGSSTFLGILWFNENAPIEIQLKYSDPHLWKRDAKINCLVFTIQSLWIDFVAHKGFFIPKDGSYVCSSMWVMKFT